MGSEQSTHTSQKQAQRAPPIRRGHTIAAPSRQETSRAYEVSASGNNSPGASVCSDTELPYISYTVNRPIGDSPKTSAKTRSGSDAKRSSGNIQPRRQMSLQMQRQRRAHDIVVVKQPKLQSESTDEDIRRLQEIPTFLPIMRVTLGLPGAKEEPVAGLDCRAWVRLTARLQAHLAACAQPLSTEQAALTAKIKEVDTDVSRLQAQFVERQRSNARHAERLARVRELSHRLTRCNALLRQTLQDVDELNSLLPEGKRLEPFVWN